MRAATSSSAGMTSSSIPASAFRAARFTMPNRVSNVALPIWGTITHLDYDAKNTVSRARSVILSSQKRKEGRPNRERGTALLLLPGLPHERMVGADMGLTFDDVEASTPNPFFMQSLRERVRVYERAACRVHQHSTFLHLAQKLRVDDMPRVLSSRRKHKEHVALAREFVQLYAPDGVQVVLRGERLFKRGVTRRCRVGRVYAVR